MRIKSFFADSVDAGMKAAHRELGAEALVLTSRRSPAHAIHLGKYEVVAGLLDERGAASVNLQDASTTVPSQPPTSAEPNARKPPLTDQVAELRRHIEGLRDYLGRADLPPLTELEDWPAEAESLLNDLTARELEPQLARSVIETALRQGGRAGQLTRLVTAELERRFVIARDFEIESAGLRMLALVGPPGAGKTTTLIKLAVRYGLLQRRPIHLVCTDWIRVGAAGQLRTYASLLGIKLHHFENPAAISTGLARFRAPDLVLIDTPGLSRAAMDIGSDLAEALVRQPGLETSLVLPASLRGADLRAAAKQYSLFQPASWIVTKLDETASHGCFVSESLRSRQPIAFVAAGQQIPEDLEPACSEKLARLVLPGEARRIASVA